MGVKAKKREFKMPHMLFLMLGIIVVASLLTYILPAGKFATDEAGNILGDKFMFIERTPVNLIQAFDYIMDGFVANSSMISAILIPGAATFIVLETKAIDRLLDLAIYKLQDKSFGVLLPAMFAMMIFLGALGMGDTLIALIPVGMLLARKLKLDPMVGLATVLFATQVGFATSPVNAWTPQFFIGVEPFYSGFGVRSLLLVITGFVAFIYFFRYAKKVRKNPGKSLLSNTLEQEEQDDAIAVVGEVKVSWRDVVIVILYLAMMILPIIALMYLGSSMNAMITIALPIGIAAGFIGRMNSQQIGDAFQSGAGFMAMIAVVIGCSGALTFILNNGNIMHTIVYYLSIPLKHLPAGLGAIGMALVVSVLNIFVPSASAKAAIICPLMRPLAQALGVELQVAVSAYMVGDGFTNIFSPALAWTMGSLAIAKISYGKWVKWVVPIVAIMMAVNFVALFILSQIGWTGL